MERTPFEVERASFSDRSNTLDVTYKCGCELEFHAFDPLDLDWRGQCKKHYKESE